jgi:hypothetical protein
MEQTREDNASGQLKTDEPVEKRGRGRPPKSGKSAKSKKVKAVDAPWAVIPDGETRERKRTIPYNVHAEKTERVGAKRGRKPKAIARDDKAASKQMTPPPKTSAKKKQPPQQEKKHAASKTKTGKDAKTATKRQKKQKGRTA